MLGTARAGLGMLVLRRGHGATHLRVNAGLRYPQRGLKLFPRFFARMIPLRQQQQQTGDTNGKPPSKQENREKHPDLGIVDPVNLPGTGIGMFGFGARGGMDAVITTLIGLTVVFFGGVAYVSWYKANVLNKIEAAFEPGYDPTLELANRPAPGGEIDEDGVRSYSVSSRHIKRKEQEIVDSIMEGKEAGHYFLFFGPKGSGKATMMIDAMRKVDADGVAICEAHPDLEVFRLRLGKALNYEYNEDTQTGLFQRRDPREGGPRLDIERAMNKLEKVAIRRAKRTGKPLIVIFNNIHLFTNDEEGQQLLQQLQQRAESWAESGVATMVFNSDGFWPYSVMRQIAHRMQTFSVRDLGPTEAFIALKSFRQDTVGKAKVESDEALAEAARIAGGRLAYLSRLARSPDLSHTIERLKSGEKSWLLTNTGLIPDCDDDVMDEQKWSSCTWLLLREFVKRWVAEEEKLATMKATQPEGSEPSSPFEPVPMPSIPYYECRQIMTRTDFLDKLDELNIIAIDVNHDVRLDSMVTLEAAREVVMEEGFDELLQGVRDRVDEIESLHRTRELTFKDVSDGDRIRVMVDKGGWRIFK